MDELVSQALKSMVRERGWDQFHTLENLAKSISIESAELLEIFQWSATSVDFHELEMELADVLTYTYLMCLKVGKTPESLILDKLSITKQKYPVDKAYGNHEKYTEF